MKFKLFFLLSILSISTLFFIQSCKKFDTTKTEIETNEVLNTEKFFYTNRTNDPVEQKLVAFIKNQNEKLHFLEKTVNIIGFPRWNKTMVYKTEKSNFASSNDSTITYHIPFVREAQNFVNASLVITTNNNDTTFSYLQDVQYLSLQNNTNSYTDSAEYFAVFFMQMDKNVFGHNKFAIIDSNLFKFNNHRITKVSLDSAITSNNLIDGGLCYLTTLSWINCYTNTCTWNDYFPQCLNSTSWTYCTAGGNNFPPAGFPPNGGAPSGGNGPGGGGSNAGTPIIYIPLPIEDEPGGTAQHFNINNPCNVVDSLLKTANFKNNLKTLRDSCSRSYEIGISFKNPFDSANYSKANYSGQFGQDSLSVTMEIPLQSDGAMHNHNNNPSRLPNASADDLAQYWGFEIDGRIKNIKTFTYTVVTNNTSYIFMITDSTKFMNFGENYTSSNDAFRTFQYLLHEIDRYGKKGVSNLENEVNFLKSLSKVNGGAGAGLKVFKGNANMTAFSPIKISANSLSVETDPCN